MQRNKVQSNQMELQSHKVNLVLLILRVILMLVVNVVYVFAQVQGRKQNEAQKIQRDFIILLADETVQFEMCCCLYLIVL